MLRLGLCCMFKKEPITFKRTTAAHQGKFKRTRQLEQIAAICRHNAESLGNALAWCRDHGILDFRINSQILPLKTHPQVGYAISDLPGGEIIREKFQECGDFCRQNKIRTTFHPDQFILLSSPDPEIVERSVKDLVYQAEVAEWVGADVVNIHGGGAYGDKASALKRLAGEIDRLPDGVRSRLTLENDDRIYTPADLLPLCRKKQIPLVYDVHHHRCLPDDLKEERATDLSLATWNREPLFHVSSPLHGWKAKTPANHHGELDPADFPAYWLDLGKSRDLTVEIEAKNKEIAILNLKAHLNL